MRHRPADNARENGAWGENRHASEHSLAMPEGQPAGRAVLPRRDVTLLRLTSRRTTPQCRARPRPEKTPPTAPSVGAGRWRNKIRSRSARPSKATAITPSMRWPSRGPLAETCATFGAPRSLWFSTTMRFSFRFANLGRREPAQDNEARVAGNGVRIARHPSWRPREGD